MTLEREYDPTVQDANKVNTLPEIKELEAKRAELDKEIDVYLKELGLVE